MAKFIGAIGYGVSTETVAGVWEDIITERKYSGDLLRNSRKSSEGETLNNDISIGNSVSIVADAYVNEHIFAIRYIKWMGGYWTVSSVEVQPPRLLLRMGEVYHGVTATVA